MEKNSVKISVVVPLFNEEESLVELYEQLSKAVCSLEKPIEFLFIDDGSTDGSMQVLTELHKKRSTSTGCSVSQKLR